MAEAIRLGVIVPSVKIVVEEWYPQIVPGGVSVHLARMLIAACLNFRSHSIIDVLEARIGRPVVTSTQAVLWHLLRLAGVDTPIHGFGRLLEEH
jgi:maleate cis-trans isomerase